jgi:acyl transferase domain-containing protein
MDDRVVVTGMAGTFPGARDVDALWNAVAVARVAPRASLASRWGIARERYMGAPGATDRTYTDLAFCVEDSARAGEKRDPQVRLGVRAIRGALADASRAGTPIDPRETGLVVATSWTAPSYFEGDAARALERFGVHVRVNGEAQDPAAQMAALGESLGGPRIAVDTACASSLYALDVALGLLEVGRARTVVVLGLNAMLPAFLYLGFAKLMALSPSGAIRPFAKDGDGIVPGECAAAVVLEKRDDARRAGRVSYGVVRSVGISADGSERSVFAPGAQGQQLAYERAYRGIDPRDVDYVEAHGTATAVGDETEIATLEAFFGRDRASRGHLPIGSVKSLVGHTLAAAGMVSLVKVLCMLRARTIPPHIEVEPHPSFVGTSLTLPRTSTPWLETPGRPRRAGISCFGFGGANAHVIVESDDDHAPASSSSSASIASSIPDEPLAIVDMETALGSADHFGRLPERFTMDAAGLRTGPNLIRRVDALQLLVTHLTRELLERNPSARGSTDTGVAMTSNLGGDLSLRNRSGRS